MQYIYYVLIMSNTVLVMITYFSKLSTYLYDVEKNYFHVLQYLSICHGYLFLIPARYFEQFENQLRFVVFETSKICKPGETVPRDEFSVRQGGSLPRVANF